MGAQKSPRSLGRILGYYVAGPIVVLAGVALVGYVVILIGVGVIALVRAVL